MEENGGNSEPRGRRKFWAEIGTDGGDGKRAGRDGSEMNWKKYIGNCLVPIFVTDRERH